MSMENLITVRQKELLAIIYQYIKDTGYPPSFEEMKAELGVSSNQSVVDLLNQLVKKEVINKDESVARGVTILPLGYKVLSKPSLAPFIGVTSAGLPVEAVEIVGEWQTLSKEVSQLKNNVFLLKIFGDSMINAGIDDGDVVLVKQHSEFVSGEIVLAKIRDESTVKRFISQDSPPYVFLKPENPEHKIIPFTDDVRLIGKVISIFKQGAWQIIK